MKWICLFIVVIGFKVNAQDPQLFDTIWYLEKVVISGTEHLPPVNSEVEYIELWVEIDYITTDVCSVIGGTIIDFTNSDFEVATFNVVQILCNLQVNTDFEVIYFTDFFHFSFPNIIINYIIEPGANDSLVLTLTNDNGDTAIYGNVLLSNQEFSEQSITIYPNPVQDVITIEKNNTVEITAIKVYDALGRLVLAVMGDVNQLDVSPLNSGIFFLKIETEGGILTKKIIKE